MVYETNSMPIGVGRTHFNSPHQAQIRYMAVDSGYQGKGIGSLILEELENRIIDRGGQQIVLNAREGVLFFLKDIVLLVKAISYLVRLNIGRCRKIFEYVYISPYSCPLQ